MKLLKIDTEFGPAFPNLDNMAGIGIDVNTRTVMFTIPNGQRDSYILRTEEEAARLVRELDKYTIDTPYHTEGYDG